ncbi:MAG: DUF4254 domain-containing protein [Rhodobiaceae bacterium]|nr:DUF4254 domain-containing protein [Rhodobiaceae bacterium]MCC0054950.1 DUF4254 domain-containing protein [Rhodobiaceae bacterium]
MNLTAGDITALQDGRTKAWHESEPSIAGEGLLRLAEENHWRNFALWHEEDKARRDDMGAEYVYTAKRAIDGYNQQRNNFIEKMDELLFGALGPFAETLPMNSETPGMMIDRLSILSLKRFHMWEETVRDDADDAHIAACRHKLQVIEKQRGDLASALDALLAEAGNGKRGFRVYYQFKMYNDPALNPELYRKK